MKYNLAHYKLNILFGIFAMLPTALFSQSTIRELYISDNITQSILIDSIEPGKWGLYFNNTNHVVFERSDIISQKINFDGALIVNRAGSYFMIKGRGLSSILDSIDVLLNMDLAQLVLSEFTISESNVIEFPKNAESITLASASPSSHAVPAWRQGILDTIVYSETSDILLLNFHERTGARFTHLVHFQPEGLMIEKLPTATPK